MKKWSYVAAAMLTVASGLALTSCIDNDEPFGITEIRKATANLLDAKRAAVEAEAAAKSAQVEIAKINAEIEKLRIEKEKIEAEANAELLKAQAEYEKAKADAERLRAEGQKAIDEATAAKLLKEAAAKEQEADYWQAQADAIRLDAQGRYDKVQQDIADAQQNAANAQRDADRKYAEAIYWFEKTKADNVNTWNKGLWMEVECAFNIYLQKIKDFNEANYQLQYALNKMAAIEADLVWVEDKNYEDEDDNHGYVSGHFESPNYGKKKTLEDLIAAKEREIKTYEDVVDIYDEFMTKLNEFNDGNWATLLEDYEKKLADAKFEAEQEKLKFNELGVDNKATWDAPQLIEDSITEFKAEKRTIPTFTIDSIKQLSAINRAWSNPIPVVVANNRDVYPYDNVYYVTNDQNMPWLVNTYKGIFNGWIKKFTMAMFDENDKAWTEATLTELKRQAANDAPYKEAEANWKMAKNAYNMGGVPDASALPLADKLDDAINAYNAYEGKIKDARNAKIQAEQAEKDAKLVLDEKVAAYNNGEIPSALATFLEATEVKDKAVNNANAIYAHAVGGTDPITGEYISSNEATLYKEKENSLQKIANYVQSLFNEYKIKQADYTTAQAAADAAPENTALAEAAETARKAATTAYEEYNNYRYGHNVEDSEGGFSFECKYDEDTQAVEDEYTTACNLASATRNKAVAEAQNTWLKAYDTFLAAGGNNLPENDKEGYKPVADAESAWKKALEDLNEANNALQEVESEVKDKIAPIHQAVIDQYTEMGFNYYGQVWDYRTYDECIPQESWIDSYITNTNPKAKFPKAVAPVMYLNESTQVYSNAKSYVISTSRIAYGDLGTNVYSYTDGDYDITGEDTYDLISDQAFLIDDVTVETLNMYIKKMLVNRGWYEEDQINPFIISDYYSWFGLFGAQWHVLEMISRAEICLADGADNAISDQIGKLVEARDNMLDECKKQMDELKTLNDHKTEAVKARQDLIDEAQAKVDAAQYIVKVYDDIVNQPTYVEGIDKPIPGLKEFVTNLKDEEFKDFYPEEEFGTTAAAIEKAIKIKMKSNEDKLAHAQEALAYYQYQLEQFESEAYEKVENPYKFEVEYWQAEADRFSEEMEFWKQRYLELQAEYEAAKKTANYPAD